MPLTEIFVKLAVGFPRDPKVRALARYGADAGLARDLYVQMILYCRENLTDGWVPAEEIGALAYPLPIEHANQLANQLASVLLTKEESKNEANGWLVLSYVKRNGTRKDVERLSEVRAASGRQGGRPPKHRAETAGQGRGKPKPNQIAKQNESRPKQTESKRNPETESETESKNKIISHHPAVTRADDDDDERVAAVVKEVREQSAATIPDDAARAAIAVIRDRAARSGKTISDEYRYIPAAVAREPDLWAPSLAEILDDAAPLREWCRECSDPVKRQRETPDGTPFRCPACHPLAGQPVREAS